MRAWGYHYNTLVTDTYVAVHKICIIPISNCLVKSPWLVSLTCWGKSGVVLPTQWHPTHFLNSCSAGANKTFHYLSHHVARTPYSVNRLELLTTRVWNVPRNPRRYKKNLVGYHGTGEQPDQDNMAPICLNFLPSFAAREFWTLSMFWSRHRCNYILTYLYGGVCMYNTYLCAKQFWILVSESERLSWKWKNVILKG